MTNMARLFISNNLTKSALNAAEGRVATGKLPFSSYLSAISPKTKISPFSFTLGDEAAKNLSPLESALSPGRDHPILSKMPPSLWNLLATGENQFEQGGQKMFSQAGSLATRPNSSPASVLRFIRSVSRLPREIQL